MNQVKTCVACSETLPFEEFGNWRRSPDGLHSRCKTCKRKYDRDYYAENPLRLRRSAEEKRKLSRERNRAFVAAYLAEHPCVECGEADPVVLDFDHVRGEKAENVSNMVAHSFSLKAIAEEIEKCEVRCSNCHRRITHRRRLAAKLQQRSVA